jgi:hypothetical protein
MLAELVAQARDELQSAGSTTDYNDAMSSAAFAVHGICACFSQEAVSIVEWKRFTRPG